jgi:hypothetical protein
VPSARQPPAQPRFADTRIADEDEFRSGVVDYLGDGSMPEERVQMQIPNKDNGVSFTKGDKAGQAWVEGCGAKR